MNYDSEYNLNIINSDVDKYFNNLLTKNTVNQPNQLSSFYYNYIEHNLIFIIILILLVVFFIIRYYTKDLENEYKNNKEDEFVLIKPEINPDEIENEKKRIEKERKRIDKEKKEIYNIINELSSINSSLLLNSQEQQIKIPKKSSSSIGPPPPIIQQAQHVELQTYNADAFINNSYSNLDNNYDKKNLINGVYVQPPYN